jgi:hypothetical protein
MCGKKYWEIIADNLSKAGWSWGCVSALDCKWRTIWIADPHRDDGKRFVVHADEKLTAFVELEAAIRACVQFSLRTSRGAGWPQCRTTTDRLRSHRPTGEILSKFNHQDLNQAEDTLPR